MPGEKLPLSTIVIGVTVNVIAIAIVVLVAAGVLSPWFLL